MNFSRPHVTLLRFLTHEINTEKYVYIQVVSTSTIYSPAKTFSSKSLGIDNQFSWVFKIKIIRKITVKL